MWERSAPALLEALGQDQDRSVEQRQDRGDGDGEGDEDDGFVPRRFRRTRCGTEHWGSDSGGRYIAMKAWFPDSQVLVLLNDFATAATTPWRP